MNFISLFDALNSYLVIPSTLIFVSVGILLTLKTKFLQVRAISHIKAVLNREQDVVVSDKNTTSLSPFKALFTAMATTIGMGNVVGPSVAIMMGGPGALFWLLLFPFVGGLFKFVEVAFAITTRVKMPTGRIVGGPAEYLNLISPWLGRWYGFATIFLFTVWTALQSNTLGQILQLEGVPPWVTGMTLALILAAVVFGGVKRIGNVASVLVPIMFVVYVSFALYVLLSHAAELPSILKMVVQNALTLKPALGGLAGGSLLYVMKSGIYRSIYITEAGLGTSSIAHSLAEVKKPTDQAILAMYSIIFDAFLSLLSGLIVLITGVWQRSELDSTVIYQAFKTLSPFAGRYVLLVGVGLFVITTVIGNTLNGSQSFAAITQGRFIKTYLFIAVSCVFLGALGSVPLLWEFSDFILTLVAVPNVISLLILAYKKPETLRF